MLPASVVRVRLIYRPVVRERDLFQIRIWVDGERVFGHGKHLAVPDRVAKRTIGRSLEHRSNRLRLAGAAGNSNEPARDGAILDRYFGGQDAILRDSETAHAGADDPLVGRGNGPDVASGRAHALH